MRQLICMFILFVTVACDDQPVKPYISPPLLSKVIKGKVSPVENRISGWDTLTGDGGVRTKSTTVYYLIAVDGTRCEVDLGTFYRVELGSTQTCERWK